LSQPDDTRSHPVVGFQVASVHSMALRSAIATSSNRLCLFCRTYVRLETGRRYRLRAIRTVPWKRLTPHRATTTTLDNPSTTFGVGQRACPADSCEKFLYGFKAARSASRSRRPSRAGPKARRHPPLRCGAGGSSPAAGATRMKKPQAASEYRDDPGPQVRGQGRASSLPDGQAPRMMRPPVAFGSRGCGSGVRRTPTTSCSSST
jgi:hypothetical protein